MNQQEQHLAARDAGLNQLAWPLLGWVAMWDATTLLRAAWFGPAAAATRRDAMVGSGVSQIGDAPRTATPAPTTTQTQDYRSAA